MRRLMRSALLLAVLLVMAGVVQASSITVDAGGSCTLSDAITAANSDTATGGCAAGSGADIITLQTDVTLAAALPQITTVITIEGGGLFISGNNARRVLEVASTGNLTVNKATIKGGDTTDSGGGGIRNFGTVTLTNSTVSGNSSSSFFYSSSCYGGGIYNSGTVTLTNSTVSGNSAAGSSVTSSCSGGGIYNSGTVTLTNSTVRGNSSSSYFYSSCYGGGIYNSGTVTLTNSTVSGNSSSYGEGIYNSGTVTLTNSTVSGNSSSSSYSSGGGIYNSGTVTLRSSIISGNAADSGKEVNQYSGTINADSYNVFGHSGETSADAFGGFTPSASDVNATGDGGTPKALAAILSPLADNGGTLTHALVAGSPAIDLDTACSAGLSTDQRGVTRPQGSGCDAGAYEYDAVPSRVNMVPVYKLLLIKERADQSSDALNHPIH